MAESRMQDIVVAKLHVDIQDGSIPGPSGVIDIRITRPLGRNGDVAVVMYFHGGGWVVGDRHTHDRLVRELAHAAGPAVVFVEYSRSPEARYPVASRASRSVGGTPAPPPHENHPGKSGPGSSA